MKFSVQILTGLTLASSLFSEETPKIPPVKALPPPAKEIIGKVAANRYILPTNQVITPTGVHITLPGVRPQALALSPNGKLLVAAGSTNKLLCLNPVTGAVIHEVTFAADPPPPPEKKPADKKPPEKKETDPDKPAPEKAPPPKPGKPPTPAPASGSALSLTGLIFSPNGKRIYLSNVVGTIKVFSVDDRETVTALGTFHVPEARTSKRKMESPTGLAISADGKKLYVAGNVANRLHELDAETGAVHRSWDTGVAPFDVVLAAGKVYVSNSGGRRPDAGALTAPAGAGTKVRVDPVRHIVNEGTVTVVDLAASKVKTEVKVELHASGMAVSPNGEYVVVCNTGSDTLSVIDTSTDTVTEKIWARRTPGDLFGAQPSSVTFDGSGKRLYVCNGTQNSVAVIKFEPKENESAVVGLIPVGWFPGAVVFDAPRKTVCVANIKGVGSGKQFKPSEKKVKFNSKEFFGSVSLVPAPAGNAMEDMTTVALLNMRYARLAEAALPPRPKQPPRPVPERVGEPSVFKHVIYVIKENRTYDQVLGDILTGNGDPSLCVFGEKVTPNLHKICREFVLLDNTFCCSVQSADGHQWTDSAITNGYVERQQTSGYPRSYTGAKAEDAVDALAWSSTGFIWDNVLAHGKTFRNYGEWMLTDAGWKDPKDPKDPKKNKEKPKWEDFWADYKNKTGLTKLASHPGIESLRAVSKLDTVGWDLNVPDQMRVDAFITELKEFEENGKFPSFCLVFLPNDHTGGTRGKTPTPAAQVADNDLAMGRLVEAISHSKFWPETCLFAIEDDPQAGWDHVSAYRTTCYVVSPYTKRKQTVSTPYNHPGLLRTMELILGLPPMNQMDATSTPLFDCFTNTPDFTPFKSVPNTTPLDTFNPEPKKVADTKLREDAIASANLNLEVPDKCPEDELNQILWRAMKGPDTPYPRWAVKNVEDDDDD